MKVRPKIKIPKKAVRRRVFGLPSKVTAPEHTMSDPFKREYMLVRDLSDRAIFEGSGPELKVWLRERNEAFRKGHIYGPRPASSGF